MRYALGSVRCEQLFTLDRGREDAEKCGRTAVEVARHILRMFVDLFVCLQGCSLKFLNKMNSLAVGVYGDAR